MRTPLYTAHSTKVSMIEGFHCRDSIMGMERMLPSLFLHKKRKCSEFQFYLERNSADVSTRSSSHRPGQKTQGTTFSLKTARAFSQNVEILSKFVLR